MQTLPLAAMRDGCAYTYIAGERYTDHVTLRRSVIERAKTICADKGASFQVYKPERLLAIAHLVYDCCDTPFHDEIIIIDGSDRKHLYSCIAFAPWAGKSYEMTSGSALESDFARWVDKAIAALDSDYDSDCDGYQEFMQEAISSFCEKYFFDVQAIPTTIA